MKKKITLLALCLSLVAVVFWSCSSDNDNEVVAPNVFTVTTAPVSAINQTTATSGGTVVSDGGSAVISRGICWSTTQNPTISGSKTVEQGTTGAFTSTMQGLTANTMYYVRAYATNGTGTVYGQEVSFTTTVTPVVLPTVTTAVITAITQTTATSGGNVTVQGSGPVTEMGVCWAITPNPTTSNFKTTQAGAAGVFTSQLTQLTANTMYYVRAYATNSGGTSYGNQVTFTTLSTSPAGPAGGNAICDGSQQTVVVPITSATGKIWMDRNLGASRAATSSTDHYAYGCLYQWGRGNDGHASITWVMGEADDWGNDAGSPVNGATMTLSSTDSPGHNLFIADSQSMPYDWRNPKNNNLWQGATGINNPCPSGYRVPTKAEFQAEIAAYSINGSAAAFNSIHKFPMAGDRGFDSGVVRGQGEFIFYWTSTASTNNSYNVLIEPGVVYTNVDIGRAGGYSVRCIKN